MPLPNLFILGAAKSGTSSLHATLGNHSDVYASHIKEPTFFCSYFQIVSDPVTYFNLFKPGYRYNLESSHAYLSNPETPPIIGELFPEAKFILTLRDPKKRAYSLFHHMRRQRKKQTPIREPLENFFDALNAESERFVSDDFRLNCRHYFWNFMYCRSGLYDQQIKRYIDIFGLDRIYVTTLASLSKEPTIVLDEICRFLDISPLAGEAAVFERIGAGRYEGSFDAESDRFMDAFFGGLTERVDGLVGKKLDWSK